MNDRLIKRNRILTVVALVVLIAVLVFTQNHFNIGLAPPAPEETPETIIEATGNVDVIYFAHEPRGHNAPDLTPKVGVGLLWYPPGPFDCDENYHIELTSTGHNRVHAPYEWSPELDEPLGDKKHLWNWEKLFYYKENALFPPGEYSRVLEALSDLSEWYAQKALREMAFAVMEAAMSLELEEPWRVIEVDIVVLMMPVDSFGISEDGEPLQSVVSFPEVLQGTLQIWRSRPITVDLDGKPIESKRKVDHIVAEGELTWREFTEMIEAGQINILPGRTAYGQLAYERGHNCVWQGREIEIIRERTAGQ